MDMTVGTGKLRGKNAETSSWEKTGQWRGKFGTGQPWQDNLVRKIGQDG
jgi:hypothetical protein